MRRCTSGPWTASETIRLHDGTVAAVRPIEPFDAAALTRFHESLTDETTRRRFLMWHPHLTAAELARFTNVDHRYREALVLVVLDEIIAVGRYEGRVGESDAEVAFVVRDRWQAQGAATALLAALVPRAVRAGMSRFVACTLAENKPMREVFRHSGLPMTTTCTEGIVTVTLFLHEQGQR